MTNCLSTTDPRTTLSSTLDGLGSIREDGVRPKKSIIPNSHRQGITSHDYEQGPPDSVRSSEEDSPQFSGRAAAIVASSRYPGTFKAFQKGKHVDGGFSSQGPIRASTMETQYSLAFSETEIWDQKTILSLGGSSTIYPSPTALSLFLQLAESSS